MTVEFQIYQGLPKGHEHTAAALYWEAFGAKLGKLLGPEERGVGFFQATVNATSIFRGHRIRPHTPRCLCRAT